jgi:hypothetical protein
MSTAVIRSVEEFKLLFPSKLITTNDIHEWCKVVESKRRIRRILGKNFNVEGVRQWSIYK